LKRRALLAGAAAAALLARARARAQPSPRVYRVGVLLPMAGLTAEPYLVAMRRRLLAHGLVEDRNLRLEIRYGASPAEARELAATRPDALFALTTALASSLHAAAADTPKVFAWVADPVQAGLVQSYARPGGSMTGVTNRFYELVAKRVELMRELLPTARRVALVAGTFDAAIVTAIPHAEAAAARAQMTLLPVEMGVMWTRRLEEAVAGGAEAILVLTPFSVFGLRYYAEEVVRFSLARRVPMLFSDAESVPLGGLMSYGNDPLGEVEQAADMLARVLMGAKPADLAVQLAARFHLAVNLKTARAIGVEVPQSILLRADRVVE
jgi:putative ABC transport system substrate-binding protein